MVDIDYVRHDIDFAFRLLIVCVRMSSDNNSDAMLIVRATLTILETLKRNINKQIEEGEC